MPGRLVEWRFTLFGSVYSHSRSGLSTDHLRWLRGFKEQYFQLYLWHVSVLSSFRLCFPSLEDLFQFSLFFRNSSDPVCVCVFLGCCRVGHYSQGKF